jgi:CubicO group peptidase (beta-lactamase class C family)
MADVHGEYEDRFKGVADVLAGNLDAGKDVGASVAVVLDDKLVVDIWGGFTDEARTRPWERDTITNVWSSTKTITSLCANSPPMARKACSYGTSWATRRACRAGTSR